MREEQGTDLAFRTLSAVPWLAGWLALLLLLASGLITPAAALACNPGRQNDYPTAYSKGWSLETDAPSHNWHDVFARLTVVDPYVFPVSGLSDPTTNGSYAWIMLVNPSSGDLAQFGPFVDNNGDRWAFSYCWSTVYGTTWELSAQKPLGYSVADEVTYNADESKSFYQDGSKVGSCNYLFAPREAQAAGEVHTAADQMVGTTASQEPYTNAYVTDYNGVEYNLFAVGGLPGGTNPEVWIGQSESDSQDWMHIWDTAC